MGRCLCLFLPLVLLAQNAQDPADLRQKLAVIQGRLGQVDQQLASLKKRRKGVLVEMQGISLQRDRVKAQVEGARLRRDQAQGEVQVIGREQTRIQSEVQRLQGDLRRQVRWMQALGPWGDLGLYVTFKDLEAWLVRGRMLAWARLQERKRLTKSLQQLDIVASPEARRGIRGCGGDWDRSSCRTCCFVVPGPDWAPTYVSS